MFTLTYSVRLVYYVFFNSLGYKTSLSMEEEIGISLPIMFLFLMSIFAGGMMRVVLFPVVCVILPFVVKVSILFFLGLLAYRVYIVSGMGLLDLLRMSKGATNYLGTMWFLPVVSTAIFMPLLKLGQMFLKFIDQGWLEFIGGQGIITQFRGYSVEYDSFNVLNIKSYLLLFFFLIIFVYVMCY